MNVREATIQLLRRLGITTIFGNPGSTELPLFRDYPNDFTYVLALQEAIAVGMADGYAQATRKAAFVNLHSSAGTGNALGNLFTAYKNRAPLVVTAGQQARSILPFEPFLHAERPTEFPRPFVKWACEPARAEDVPLALARAYFEAMTPPYGPTFVSIPVDDWDKPCEPLAIRQVATENPGERAAIAELSAAILSAQNPAFVLGAGTARDGAWDAIIALAERQNASVYAGTYAGRNVFPEDHPLFCGFLPAFREKLVHQLAGHDLIVAMGGPLHVYHAEGFGPHIPPGAQLWTVGDDPGVAAWAPVGRAILGNSRAIAEQLFAYPAAAARKASRTREAAAKLDAKIFDDRLLFSRLDALLPAGAIIVEEAPSSRPAMQQYLRLSEPDTFYTTGSGGLGYAMPAAVGIALARPQQRVVCVVGDGSSMYSIQALYSARLHSTPITFIICNNGSYLALQQFGNSFGMNEVPGTELNGLDFVSLAKGHGISGTRVTTALEFEEALTASFAVSGPTLIEAKLQRY